MIKNDQAKILPDVHIQTDQMVVTSQPDVLVVDKQEKRPVVVDVAIPNDSNLRKKEQGKLEKYQGLKEQLERL